MRRETGAQRAGTGDICDGREEPREIAGGHRTREQEALGNIAPRLVRAERLARLDAFYHHLIFTAPRRAACSPRLEAPISEFPRIPAPASFQTDEATCEQGDTRWHSRS